MKTWVGRKIMFGTLGVALIASLLGIAAEVHGPKRKRMQPDDPPGTRVFADTLPSSLNEQVERLALKYDGTNAPNPAIQEWIDKLASHEIVEDNVSGTGGTIREETVARISLRKTGPSALGALIRATTRPNKMIRNAAMAVILDIASASDIQLDVLPVFLRSVHDVDRKPAAIGAISGLCKSLARKKRYEDCEVCLKSLASLAGEKDDQTSTLAVLRLSDFDRLDLVPPSVLARPEMKAKLAEWIEASKTMNPSGHFPLPKPKTGEPKPMEAADLPKQ
jgi:hypothetical protein